MEHVDLTAVAEWMSQQGLGEGPLDNVSPVTGGTQNVMVRFERSGRPYVLRRGQIVYDGNSEALAHDPARLHQLYLGDAAAI